MRQISLKNTTNYFGNFIRSQYNNKNEIYIIVIIIKINKIIIFTKYIIFNNKLYNIDESINI